MPKILGFVLFGFVFFTLSGFSTSNNSEVLKIKGFYLGMDKSEVSEIYQKYKSEEIAKYISIESTEFRDLIQLDNEFSSMGNKIEINYDDDGKVTYIKFQYKTVQILFDDKSENAEEFVKNFEEEFNIPDMKYEDMGFVKSWNYQDEERKFSLSIDDYMNITLKKI